MKIQAPSRKEPKEAHRAFFARWYNTWIATLQLNADLIKLSREEAKALAQYLEANRLMIDCKAAAVRVSLQVWEGIEERMLTLSKDSQSVPSTPHASRAKS